MTNINIMASTRNNNIPSDYNMKQRQLDVTRDNILYTQSQLDYIGKKTLDEYQKNHEKIIVEVAYAPHLLVGQTVKIIDTYNNKSTRYFIAAINDNNGFFSLTCERYDSRDQL